MGSGTKHSSGQRRKAKTRERARRQATRMVSAKPVATPSVLLTSRHPYREARALGWIERVHTVMAEEAMGARRERYLSLGIDDTAFAALAAGHRSAWALARQQFWTENDADPVRIAKAIYIGCLWNEYLPHRPSMETIDDLLEAGSAALDRGEREDALRHWIAFWDALARAAPPGAGARELEGYLMSLRLADWFEVFSAEADALAADHALAPELARVRADVASRLGDAE